MARRKKNRHLGPRRKRMKRSARLQSAQSWIPTYRGKNIVRGYHNWYGVDLLCAIRELRMLGVAVNAEYEQRVRDTIEQKAKARARRREERQRAQEIDHELFWGEIDLLWWADDNDSEEMDLFVWADDDDVDYF